MAFLFKLFKTNVESYKQLQVKSTYHTEAEEHCTSRDGLQQKKNADVALKEKKSRPTGRQKTGNDSTLLLLVSTSSRCLCVIQNAVKAVPTLGVPCILN